MAGSDDHEKRKEAFLALLRYAEHAKRDDPDAYHSLYGNGHFGSLQTHPKKSVVRWGHKSDAAGAYSITGDTYEDAKKKGQVSDFSERSQDTIAWNIVTHQGAQWLIWDGNLDAAFSSLNRRWSALPGGSQQELTADEAKRYFWDRLGDSTR